MPVATANPIAIVKRPSRRTIRGVVSSAIIIAIIAGLPVFSFIELGSFFYTHDSRSSAALPPMTIRPPDATASSPQLFSQPLVSVTFDDGFESVYKTAMPMLQKYGIHTTQYILGGTEKETEYVSWKQIANMQKAGHEIACHSMTHPDLTSLDDKDLQYQLQGCEGALSARFGPITNFASPYGSQNDKTLKAISGVYDSQRNTNGDPTNGVSDVDVNTSRDFDPYNIIGVTVRSDTTVKELQELVAFAKLTNGWVVLTYHQADEGGGSQFAVDQKKLEAQFAYLSQTDVRIVTMQQAISSYKTQKANF